MPEKRAVILGAAGFIGSHLCDRFLKDGWRVVGVDNLVTGSRDNLEHLCREANFDFIEADICQSLEVPGPVEAVLDFASPASPVHYLAHPLETLHVGSIGVENALKLAKKKGARFLLASTSEVYGDPLEHPQRETYFGNVNPVGPRAVYDEAKRFAEAITMVYRNHERVDTGIARIFNTYGPRMRLEDGRVVPAFVAHALRGEPLTVFGDGSQTRSFCYIEDNVDCIVRLVHSDYGEPVNVGNPHEMTILEFAEWLRRAVETKSPIVFAALPENDPRVRRPDVTRARVVLGWEPRVGFEEGMLRTVAWFRERIGRGEVAVAAP
ncbi:MAG TPA: UDP-glucuronic acid decarboxylase family protein [Anaeromyxobacteraceae bacterium]|nr:UDP-glucuronic acid decarboxylase family protein [Anaeromyxobacteraceae bacterium]